MRLTNVRVKDGGLCVRSHNHSGGGDLALFLYGFLLRGPRFFTSTKGRVGSNPTLGTMFCSHNSNRFTFNIFAHGF